MESKEQCPRLESRGLRNLDTLSYLDGRSLSFIDCV
jgi:hypothetical protein